MASPLADQVPPPSNGGADPDLAAAAGAAAELVPAPVAKADDEAGLLQSLGTSVLSSIPVLSAMLFVAVAIKVFRASNMETTTTVAVVSSADLVNLLEGVILTLLPGFLAGVVAISIWWWSRDLTDPTLAAQGSGHARQLLRSPRTVVVWVLLAVAFYTITWPLFVIFLIPVGTMTVLLAGQERGRWHDAGATRTLLRWMRGLSAVLAIGAILLIALSPTVWLPLRAIHLQPGTQPVMFDKKQLPARFAAFVLSSNSETTSLLLNSPRGVMVIPTKEIQPNPPLCVPSVSSLRWANLRASQVIHLDHDYGSPYPTCP